MPRKFKVQFTWRNWPKRPKRAGKAIPRIGLSMKKAKARQFRIKMTRINLAKLKQKR